MRSPSIDPAFLEEALGVLGVGEILTREIADCATRWRSIRRSSNVCARRWPMRCSSTARARTSVIGHVIDARNAARKARDFALADRLRNALSAEGIVLTDGKDGSTSWTVAGA